MGELADEKELADLIEGNKYAEEDLIDAEFWESGVEEPADLDQAIIEALDGEKKKGGNLIALSAIDRKTILTTLLQWKAAFTALDTKFIARALLARELKVVFAKKREQVRSHPHCARSSSLILLSAHSCSLLFLSFFLLAAEGCARAGRPVVCFGRCIREEGRARHRHGRQDFVEEVRLQNQVPPVAMWLLQIRARLQQGLRLRHGRLPQHAFVLGLARRPGEVCRCDDGGRPTRAQEAKGKCSCSKGSRTSCPA
jgi:hypothetical protein